MGVKLLEKSKLPSKLAIDPSQYIGETTRSNINAIIYRTCIFLTFAQLDDPQSLHRKLADCGNKETPGAK